MKKFEDVLMMDQNSLKNYLTNYLRSRGYKAINEDGFLYAKGDIPVLLLAHLDRHPAHKELVKEIDKLPYSFQNGETQTRWSSPQGICGDDRCGVWAIMNVLKKYKPSVLFCEDEEKGSLGAKKFIKTDYVNSLEVDFMVQIDRRGSNDAVFYSCDNKEFTKWIEETTGYKEKSGTFTDICDIMPVAKTAAVNLSSGYYNEHSKDEYIVIEELEHTIETVEKLLETEIALGDNRKQYNYVEGKRKYSWGSRWNDYPLTSLSKSKSYSYFYYDDDDYDDNAYWKVNTNKPKKCGRDKYDTEVTLTAVLDDGTELTSTGASKPEAWMWLFMDNGSVCYDQVIDYYYE